MEHEFIDEIEDIPSPKERQQVTSPSPSKRITRSMKQNQNQEEDKKEERRQRDPSFQIIVRKSRKSESSSIGIDPHQIKLDEHI